MKLTSNQLKEALSNTILGMRRLPRTELTPVQVVDLALGMLRDEIHTIEQQLQQRKESQANMDRPSANKAW